MRHLLTLTAAFAAGAALSYWLGNMMMRVRIELPPDDAQLREQVRARVLNLVSDPDAIEVEVQGGLVRISGPVLPGEMDGLLSKLTHLPGVHKVHNALRVRPSSLQT